MKQFELILLCFIVVMAVNAEKCEDFIDDMNKCIQSTPNSFCIFDKVFNTCMSNNSPDYGCDINMNLRACLGQEYPYKCQFINSKCRTVDDYIIKRADCQIRNFNKPACLSLEGRKCTWENNVCKNIDSGAIEPTKDFEQWNCQNSWPGQGVSPKACSIIQNAACKHMVTETKCFCQNIEKDETDSLTCSTPGLSRLGCMMVTREDQYCIYDSESLICKDILYGDIDIHCNLFINKNACLRANNCIWNMGGCTVMTMGEVPSDSIQVSLTVCSLSNYLVRYDTFHKVCVEIKENEDTLPCNTPGLSLKACMQQKQNCIFQNGQCSEVTNFSGILCQSSGYLNKASCLNVKTSGQYCHWNGEKCQNIQIYQSLKCEDQVQVNANLCQSIISEPCKYDSATNSCKLMCIDGKSCQQEKCNAEGVNLIGCTSIIRLNETCKWQNQQCNSIIISIRSFKCQDMAYVNANVCSKFQPAPDNPDIYCGFNQKLMGCQVLSPSVLDTLLCGVPSLGLNNEACSAIRTPGQVCHFWHGTCKSYKLDQSISIPCDWLKYANPATCARTVYKSEFCSYNEINKGCTIHMTPSYETCDEEGINIYSCQSKLQIKCFFSRTTFKCSDTLDSQLSILKCDDGVGKESCLRITTPGEKCSYDDRKKQCVSLIFNEQKPCISDAFSFVNPNVCASISHPDVLEDYSLSGYCIFDSNNKKCTAITDMTYVCPEDDRCCTNVPGFNISSCSRFSRGICYFQDQKCQQFNTLKQYESILIQNKFDKQKLTCQQANYDLCGKINWTNSDSYNMCYQPSQNNVCSVLPEKKFIEFQATNIKIFFSDTTRANKWICKRLDQLELYVRYNPDLGNCATITSNIDCSLPDINKNACISKTASNYCIWDKQSLTCSQLSLADIQNVPCTAQINEKACLAKGLQCQFNTTSQQCENLNLLTQINCNGLPKYLTYNFQVCTQIVTVAQSCIYNSDLKTCAYSELYQQQCDGVGFNEYNCYANTKSSCQWDSTNRKCVDLDFEAVKLTIGCEDKINKFTCMKVLKEGCKWEDSTKTCKRLVKDNTRECKSLFGTKDLYNERACLEITMVGNICVYNQLENQCYNTLCVEGICTGIQIAENESCTFRHGNIHYCLSRTKGFYCQYDSTTLTCSDYTGPTSGLVCDTPNINRNVCMKYTSEICKYNLKLSKCEKDNSNSETPCSAKKAGIDYLFNQKSCIMIAFDFPTDSINMAKTYCNAKLVCTVERYCYYSEEEQGCKIMDFVGNVEISGESCTAVLVVLDQCKDIYSRALCVEQVQNACYWDESLGMCKDFDGNSPKQTDCSVFSSIACTFQNDVACFVGKLQHSPSQCDNPQKYYLVCLPLSSQIAPQTIQKVDGKNTYTYNQQYLQYFLNWFSNYKTLDDSDSSLSTTQVSPRVCSQITQDMCIYDFSQITCQQIFKKSFICDQSGLSYGGCDISSTTCEYDYTAKICKEKSNPVVQTPKTYLRLYKYPNLSSPFQSSDQLSSNKSQCIQKYGWLNNEAQAEQIQIDESTCTACTAAAEQIYSDLNNNCTSKKDTETSVCNSKKIACPPINSTQPECCGQCCDDDCSNCFTGMNSNYDNCTTAANSNHTTELNTCYNKFNCQWKQFACVEIQSYQCDYLSSYYSMVPYKSCINSLTSPCSYNSDNNKCYRLYAQPNDCLNMYNKQACLHYSGGICQWSSNRCSNLVSRQYGRIRDCTMVSYNACLLLTKASCVSINQVCQAAVASVICDNMPSTANAYACSSTTLQPCYYDTNLKRCKTYDTITPQITLNCDSTGINTIGCLSYSVGYCQYLNLQCQALTIFDNVRCETVNKEACSKLTSQPCMWDTETDPSKPSCKPIVYLTQNQTCTNYSVIPQNSNNKVNEQTCSLIKNTSSRVACYHDGSNCQITVVEVPCLQVGINQDTCLTKTNEYCVFTNRCLPTGDRNQYCSESINLKLCLDLLYQPCYFENGRCKVFDFQTITDISTAKQQINLGGALYNPSICSSINLPGLPLQYNIITKKCEEITGVVPLEIRCNTEYINQQTCLSYTMEQCQLLNGKCQLIEEEILNLKETICSQFYNWKACINVDYQKCTFKDGLCQSANSDLKCSSSSLVTRLVCQTRTDVACSFNSNIGKCEVQTNNSLKCTQDGLNQIGCLQYTKNENCLFEDNTCKNWVSDQFDCSDLINEKNCGTVEKSNCFFENSCQFVTEEIIQSGKLDRCLNGFIVSNKTCSFVKDHGCKQDPLTSLCTLSSGLEDCLNDKSLNQIGCQQNKTKSKCFWKNNQCMQPTDSELSTLRCSDSVNLGTCISITTPGEYCQFINNSCQSVTLTEITASCASIVNINSYQICEHVISDSCIFNQNKCEILTTQLDTCQRGVNQRACLSKIVQICSFDTFCSDKSTLSECNQVSTQSECLKLSLQCQWLPESCVSVTQRIQCSLLPELVTFSVCDLGITTNFDILCMYDPVQYKCFEKLPEYCSDLQSRGACVKQINMACLWKDNVCNKEIPKINLNECLDYETDSSIMVCRMVHKKGQLCEYREEKCRVALYEQANWETNVNYNACLNQRLKACYWVEQTLSCVCPDAIQLQTYLSENGCSSNQSYLICTSITKQLEFCQWNDGGCTSLPLKYIDESINHDVNVNTCTLLKYPQDKTFIYDYNTKSCFSPADLYGTCEQPGLNLYGCIYQQSDTAFCSFSLGRGCTSEIPQLTESEQTNTIPILSYGSCMNQPLPKYYKNYQCLDVTPNTKCSDKVNQAGCLQIQSEGCIYENQQCYSFTPVETCAELQNNSNIQINKIVCSMVDIDQCVYKDGTCSTKIDYTTCNQEGLNYLACIAINGCIFDTKTLKCSEFSPLLPCPINMLANPNACAKAITSCSYDQAHQICIGIQNQIQCASIGLSQQGCIDMTKCLWFNNKCDCKIYYEHFPICQLITNQDGCDKYSTCKFYDGVCTSMECKFLKVPENYTKKEKQAVCAQMPNCYLKTKYQCGSTSNCESIEFDQNLYDDCSDITINNQPCKGNQQRCATLICSDFQQGECTQFSKYCHWDPKEFCTKKAVRYFTEQECGSNNNTNNNKSTYFIKGVCKEFQNCQEATGFQLAEVICNQIQAPNQCGYIYSNMANVGQCTDIPCRSFGKTRSQCNGKHINNKSVCYLKSTNCISCEETQNYCDCLEQKYCSWKNDTCISLNCNSLNVEQCSERADCYYENQNCLVKCKYHYSEYSCQQNSCQWNDQKNQCTDCLLSYNEQCTLNSCDSDKCCAQRNGCQIDCNKLEPDQCKRPLCILNVANECLNPPVDPYDNSTIVYNSIVKKSVTYQKVLMIMMMMLLMIN